MRRSLRRSAQQPVSFATVDSLDGVSSSIPVRVAVATLATFMLVACGSGDSGEVSEPSATPTSEPPPSGPVTESPAPPSASKSKNSARLSTELEQGRAVPGWSASIAKGWKPSKLGQAGITQLKHQKSGCQVTFYQNRGKLADVKKRTGTDSLNSMVERIQDKFRITDQFKPEPVDFGLVAPDNAERMNFVVQGFRHLDGDEYANVIGAQTIREYELIFWASCPSDGWDESEKLIYDYLDQVSVSLAPTKE